MSDYNAYEDYQHFHKSRNALVTKRETDSNRFVPMKERLDTTSLSTESLKGLQHGKCFTEWKGIEMLKDPIDTTIYQMMVWKIKPATVVEIGAYKGASAMWLADHLRMFNVKGHVYSLDIDLSLLDENAKDSEGITFIEGDCHKIENIFPPEMLEELHHPWIVIEDAHHNMDGVLEHFYQHMTTGDYLVVEDTNPKPYGRLEDYVEETQSDTTWGLGKMNDLRNFMKRHPTDLMVDTYYTDMFGYNGTWNINGFIRKM